MADTARIFGNRWRVLEQIGNGGQGVVFKVADIKGVPTERDQVLALKEGLRGIQTEIHNVHPDIGAFAPLIAAIRDIAAPQAVQLAAVKELLPFEDAVAADEKAVLVRMKTELDVLRSVDHPALLKVFDANLDERWFAMEYFAAGPLSNRPNRLKGNALAALRSIRSIVDAVSELHKKKTVHRDIKPDNIFIADDGRLVLGDCGLAFKLENQNRLTLSFENVGTRDYQPPWTYGMRVDEVKPNFDVFSLAKVLWAMISGRPRFPLEDFDVAPHDLREMFPDDSGILFVHRILKKAVVRREPQCQIPDASAMLVEIDSAIRALDAGAIVPTKTGTMRCRFCGVGFYKPADEFGVVGNPQWNFKRHHYCCDHCGHLEIFVDVGNKTLPAWEDS